MDGERQRRIEELLAHTRWVEALARRLARDPERAADLAQSTLLVALDAPPPALVSPRAWLARVLRNLARADHRREGQRRTVETAGARGERLPGADELIARADAERALVQAVIELGGEDSRLLLLHYFEGWKLDEIARRERVASSTLSHRFARAHERLRARLERDRGSEWLGVLVPVFSRSPKPFLEAALVTWTKKTAIVVTVLALVAASAWWLHSSSETPSSAPAVASPARADAEAAPPPAPPRSEERSTAAAQPTTPPASAPAVTTAAPASASTATLRGRVVGPRGAPAASRAVHILRMPRGPRVMAKTDVEGRFEERGLAPGSYHVSTTPEQAELEALGLVWRSGGVEWLSQTCLVLEAGAEAEVELGAPPRDPIRVVGDVRGDGAAEALLQWVPAGDHGYDRARYVYAADGRYEALLRERGTYRLSVIVTGRSVRVDELLDVPAGAEWRHDVVLPRGEIVARVVAKDGAALENVAVTIVPQAGVAFIPHMSASGNTRKTDAAGLARFGPLRAGRWRVCAVPARSSSGPAYAPRYAQIELDLLRPTSEAVLELELGVGLSGTIVADDGGELAGTSVFVFDELGEPLNPHAGTYAGKTGRFNLPALTPGRYSLLAANGDRWSSAATLEVGRDGEPVSIELHLRRASQLRVVATGLEPHALSICDESGREFAALLDRNLFSGSFARSWRPEAWNAFVPPGNYEARAVGLEGVVARGAAALLDDEAREIVLRR